MSEKIEFDLVVAKNNLTSELKNNISQAFNLEDALSTALGVFAGNAFTKGFEILGDAIGGTIDFAKDSVKAFSEQEDALNKLSQALRASGDFSNAAVEDFNAFASALQKTSVFGDEVVLSQLAVAKSFGASNAEAKSLVLAAANLSATFGGSLDENVDKLGKTLNGTVGRLAQFIPELKNLTKEQLAAGAAADIINSKFSGASQSQLATYSGSVIAAKNAFSDLQEEVGRLVAKNSLTVGFISGLTSGFQALTLAARGVADSLGIGVTPIEEQKQKLADLGKEYNTLVDQIKTFKAQTETNAKFGGDTSGEAARIAATIEAEGRLNQILKERSDIRKALSADAATAETATPSTPLAAAEIEARAKANAEILALKQQLILEENNLTLQQDNLKIADEEAKNLAEIERITSFNLTKAELEFQAREQALAVTEEGLTKDLALKQLAAEKDLALKKITNDGLLKTDAQLAAAEKANSAKRIATKQAEASTITGILGTAANVASVFAKEGSKELFFIQKAAALAQAIVATNLAIALANAVPPPGNIPAIAAAKANGAIAISGIVASAIKGFAEGGIVGQQGATTGPDNRLATVRDGEMILNASQQKNLFDAVNNNNLGGDIIIQVDGREIFRAVRNQIRNGAQL